MKRTGPKTSDNSKKIIRKLKSGETVSSLVKKGFPRSTVKYYYWKLFNVSQFQSFIVRVSERNKKRKKDVVI